MLNRMLILLVIVLPLSMATQNNITILKECYNTTIVKVTGFNETVDPSINVINFTFNKEKSWWEYKCNGNTTSIIIDIPKGKTNSYDIMIQYYISPLLPVHKTNNSLPTMNEIQNEGYKRIEQYTNMELSYVAPPIPKLSNITSSDTTIIIGLIILGIALFLLIIGIIYRIFNKDEEDTFLPVKKADISDEEEELRRLAGY